MNAVSKSIFDDCAVLPISDIDSLCNMDSYIYYDYLKSSYIWTTCEEYCKGDLIKFKDSWKLLKPLNQDLRWDLTYNIFSFHIHYTKKNFCLTITSYPRSELLLTDWYERVMVLWNQDFTGKEDIAHGFAQLLTL